MNVFRSGAALYLVLALTGLPLAAQEEQPVDFKAVQGKPVLVDEDLAVVRTWIGERVAAVSGDDKAEAAQALRDLRTGFTGTQSFKEAYAAACVAAIGSAFKNAGREPAARLLTVLIGLDETASHQVFIEALRDTRAATRHVGAAGLRRLRPKIAAAGGATCTNTLAALVDAGKRESSSVPLQTIYAALDYRSVGANTPDARTNATALLDLLEARARQYASGKVAAEGADAVGLKVTAGLRDAFDDEQKKRYTIAVANMLKYAITRYIGGEQPLHKVIGDKGSKQLRELRNSIELLIEVAEQELVALLAPPAPPQLTEKMKTSGKAVRPNMIIEWEKWVPLLEQAVGQRFSIEQP